MGLVFCDKDINSHSHANNLHNSAYKFNKLTSKSIQILLSLGYTLRKKRIEHGNTKAGRI